ncbi:MAG: N-acetyl-gamma-glutamyl-phosphate reductase [Polyangiaceae bacterium]
MDKRVGIVGVTGYTGAELVRLLHAHPRLSLQYVAARETKGKRLSEVLPAVRGVSGIADLVIEGFEPESAATLAERLDVVFTALPHGASARAVAALHEAGTTVADLSADFRLKNASVYEQWYGEHPVPALLAKAVYGQPEWHGEELVDARLIAVPGCYPTSAILAIAPLLERGLVEPTRILVDSKSGVSGAGKAPTASTHFPEAAEGIRPYKVAGSHRHTPEIEQELSRAAGQDIQITFTPHLVPMSRGILTTAYLSPRPGTTAEACREAARDRYGAGLVSVLAANTLPDTLFVRGSARAHLAYELDERTNTLLAMSAIDNLARGAAAQALQALNVALGWPAALGLPEIAMFP